MTYSTPSHSSTPKTAKSEKFSDGVTTFADFILTRNVYPATPRGELIALYRTLINANAFPRIATWSDLFRFMTVRRAAPEAIATARALWREFQKSQSAAPPGSTGRMSHG
jgi:hypothetical protein